MTFVATVTEKVHQESGLDMHAWGASMSPELGTVVWATFVDTLDQLEAAQDKLAVSDPFIALAESGAHLFTAPLQDGLAQVVTGTFDRTAPLPAYVTAARAIATNGKLSAAMAAGVEIAEAATRITGVQTSFLVDVTGPVGGCRWNSGHADIGSVERAEAALTADAGWLELIDRVGDCYQQGVTQSMYRRII
ncbi:MAG: hypothetical protein ABIY48_00220 [Acidimicrobiales bacterium]